MKFTFILGYRHTTDRLSNLRRVIEWMYSFKNAEVILIEQDTHSKLSEFNFLVNHIFLYSEQPYNRAWSFNVGMKYSTTDIIIFTDSDLLMDNEELLKSIDFLNDYDVVSPYKKVIDLTAFESTISIEEILKIKRDGRGENDNQKINLCGGMVIFNKKSCKMIGGWSEQFTSWGGEDDYQTVKVQNFLKWYECDGICYHLYHSKQIIDPVLYTNNLKILDDIKKLTKLDLINQIKRTHQNNGKRNKFV